MVARSNYASVNKDVSFFLALILLGDFGADIEKGLKLESETRGNHDMRIDNGTSGPL